MSVGMVPQVKAAALTGLVIGLSQISISARQFDTSTETVRAIRELTAEIRTLRASVEQSAERQLQGQVLALNLTLQAGRLAQATNRLDAVRRELEGASTAARNSEQEAADVDAALRRQLDPERHRQLEAEQRYSKRQAERLAAQEHLVRSRESEIHLAQQMEEAQWHALIVRLEELLKK